ncbi:MAG: tripartite tricarboxylate transporter substrate binding protein [Gammaproteobacteria bacterium]|nr:tripartite tricarboxylate transporter substrate binding protein [Gammaproteobacteria bacterium]
MKPKLLLYVVSILLLPSLVAAQANYPERPIRIIATLSAGSQVDTLIRLLAEKMSVSMGQAVIIDNRVGAGGTIAAAAVAAAPADGYTLLATANGHAINPSLHTKLSFDAKTAFSGVSLIGVVPSVLTAASNKPFKTLPTLIAAAKAKPGALSYASAGVGSASHLAVELMREVTGFDALHIPYKGSAEAIIDLVSGRVDFSFAPVGASLALIRDGKAVALAVSTTERSTLMPSVPTFAEAGVANYRFDFWYGVLAPAATSKAVVNRLAAEFQKALAHPDIQEKFARQGVIASSISPPLVTTKFDQFLAGEFVRYAALVKRAGVVPE